MSAGVKRRAIGQKKKSVTEWADSSLLVLDGAMGTELSRRGADTEGPLWATRVTLSDPDSVVAVHRDYIEAGVDIVTTNTFRCNPAAFSAAGRPVSDAKRALGLAVECARAAALGKATKKVVVAGSVGPAADCYRPDLVPSADVLEREHTFVCEELAALGVDLLLLETMSTGEEVKRATRAAVSTGLVVWVGLLTADGKLGLSGSQLSELAKVALGEGASRVGINCSFLGPTRAGLATLRRAFPTQAFLAYANAGHLVATGRVDITDDDHAGPAKRVGAPGDAVRWRAGAVAPVDYGTCALDWLGLGATILGGCCGTEPAHIRAIRQIIDNSTLYA